MQVTYAWPVMVIDPGLADFWASLWACRYCIYIITFL